MNFSSTFYKIEQFEIKLPIKLTHLSLNFSNNSIIDAEKFCSNLIQVKKNLKKLNLNLNDSKIKKTEIKILLKNIGELGNLEDLNLNLSSNFLSEDSIKNLKNGIMLMINLKNIKLNLLNNNFFSSKILNVIHNFKILKNKN